MKRGTKNKGIRLRHRPNGKKIQGSVVFTVFIIMIGLCTSFGLNSIIPFQLFPWSHGGNILTVSAAAGEDYSTTDGSNLTMAVNYGYDQYVKYGRYMNVTATITNNGNEFSGWLQVIVPKNKNNTAYRREVIINTNESKEISISLPVMDDTGFMQVKLMDKEGTIVLENKYELKIGNYEKLTYIGILSNDKEKLDYMKSFGARTFYLDETTLSDDYNALDLLDVIIINHFDTGLLSDEQVKAIEKWVMNGGTLVLGTGEYGEETLAKFGKVYSVVHGGGGIRKDITFGMDQESLKELKQDMVDYEEERKIFLENLKDRNKMLTAYGNDPIEINDSATENWTKEDITQLQLQTINKYIADVSITGSSVIALEDGYRLMQTGSIELGKVQLFSFDLGLNEKSKTIGMAILNEIRKNMSNTKLTQLEEEYYGSYLNYGIYNSMSYTNARNIPKAGKYILILAIYIIIVGPVTFIILKKIDKRNLTWGVVPLLAVIFTLLVYFMGSDTRINEPYVGYVKLLNFMEDNKVKEELYFSLTAPYNHNYTVPLEKYYNIAELRSNGDNSYLYDYKKEKIYYDNYITTIDYATENTFLEVKDTPAFSPVYYQWSDSYNRKDQLTYDIHYVGDKVYGTVTNGFDFDITNAMLTSDGYVINIGELIKGETVSLEGKDAIFMTTRDELYNTDIINRIAGGTGDVKDNTTEINRLSNVLYYLTESNLLNSQHNSCIIGFVKDNQIAENDKDSLLSELTGNMKAYGTTAVKLPVEVDYRTGNKVFVPSVDPYIVMSEGAYDKYYKSRYLSSDSMTMKYHLPNEDNIVSFEYLSKRNQDSSTEYLSAFDGSIYFLNIKTGNYDEVFMRGPGSSVTDIEEYLTKQNIITIRYSTKMSLKGYQMILPYISYWKEADSNAGN